MASLRIAHAYDIGTAVVMKSVLESEGIEVLDIGIAGHLLTSAITRAPLAIIFTGHE